LSILGIYEQLKRTMQLDVTCRARPNRADLDTQSMESIRRFARERVDSHRCHASVVAVAKQAHTIAGLES
jgi:hypothetical protein